MISHITKMTIEINTLIPLKNGLEENEIFEVLVSFLKIAAGQNTIEKLSI